MPKEKYDFGGWATKYNIKCTDDRTILEHSFDEQNGTTVPLVWNHNHKDIEGVLGHALLESRKEGMYAYCTFNGTDKGKKAKEMVKNGDIRSLSIYANQLKQNGNNVTHGMIREVSLVLAGANLGAYIDTVIAHSADHDEESIIYHPYDDEEFEFYHSDKEGEENMENTKNDDVEHSADASASSNGATANGESGKTVKEVFDAMTEEQKNVVYYLAGIIAEDKGSNAKHTGIDGDNKDASNKDVNNKDENNNTEENEMKHNCFENESGEITVSSELLHSAFNEIFEDARKTGSLKDSYKNYLNDLQSSKDEKKLALAHSITNIDYLFPEVQAVNKTPVTVDRRQDWVSGVMNGVHHSPFARVKSTAIDITADAARAKGYVKGNQKVEEVVAALKRTTTPQTIYKLQKLDRDDITDITDFDVVSYIKLEMRGKLNEEIARAILIGDGRTVDDNDKINPINIRPILGDSSVYTIAKTMSKEEGETDYNFTDRFIDEAVRSRKEYKGSGSITLFCTEDLLCDMLLMKDNLGHRMYKNKQELATALMVKDIVSVPVMANIVRTEGNFDYTLMGIFVDLTDYNVGADKGGAVNMFDDFDLDFNKYKYLIETRCSGALIKPYSAISFEKKSAHVDTQVNG